MTLTLILVTKAAQDAALPSRIEVSGTQAKEKIQLMQQKTFVMNTAKEHRQNTQVKIHRRHDPNTSLPSN